MPKVPRGTRAARLDNLYCFYLLCRAGSMKGACAELGVSISSMSEKIAALQKETGRLVKRGKGRHLVPNELGEAVYERIKPGFEILENYWAG